MWKPESVYPCEFPVFFALEGICSGASDPGGPGVAPHSACCAISRHRRPIFSCCIFTSRRCTKSAVLDTGHFGWHSES